MPQCSHRPHALPACVFALVLGIYATSLEAQDQRYRVLQTENFRQESGPQGRVLASVAAGVQLTGGAARDGWIPVALEGWVWGGSVGRTDRDGHNLTVTSAR